MQLPVTQVRQHAAATDRTAEAMGEARRAVRTVTMDSGAYGQLCQFLPAALSPVFGLAIRALNGSVDALQETGARLRTAATNVQVTDEDSARLVAAAGRAQAPPLKLPL